MSHAMLEKQRAHEVAFDTMALDLDQSEGFETFEGTGDAGAFDAPTFSREISQTRAAPVVGRVSQRR